MNFLRNASIRRKLYLVTMLTSGIAMLLVSLGFVVNDLLSARSDRVRHLSIQAEMIAVNVGAPMLFSDRQAAEELLDSLRVDPGIISASLLAADGKPFAERGQIIRDWERSTLIEIVREVKIGDQRLGQLRIYSDLSFLRDRVQYIGILALVTLFVAGLVAWFLSERLQHMVTAPLARLADVSQRVIAHGDYSVRVDVAQRDELGNLAKSFNRMLEQIEQRDHFLEFKVARRTEALEQLNQRLSYDACHDALTGLPNRKYFDELLTRHIEQHRNKVFAVLFLDLDNFKNINDTLGHEIGDELLVAVAARLRNALAPENTLSRFGGDEFMVALMGIESTEQARTIGQELVDAMRDDFRISGHRLNITVSIGLSFYPRDGEDVVALKRSADIAMYQAKKSGKNGMRVFRIAMENQAAEQLILGGLLRDALRDGHLHVAYQPQYDFASGRLYGVEALVRWNHPELGRQHPEDFLPFAEESGLATAIDFFVLRTACEQLAAWQQQGVQGVKVAVNLSAHHFSDREIVQVVSGILEETGIDGSCLEIEITERCLIEELSSAVLTLNELKAMGVRIAIDDFGTGYSSLRYIQRLPVDEIKIDRSFIQDIESEGGKALVRAILALAHSLGIAVIAEGVERPKQQEILKELGCERIQGYLVHAPLEPEDFRCLMTGDGCRDE